MYECLVGHLPFEGKNPAQVLRKVLDGIYQPADRERSTVGGRWAKILAAALARDAADRTRSPGAVAEQIRTELEALGITDPKAEIAAYFADPEGYSTALSARIVPKLVSRGEAARRHRDVPGAAADFNRALALHPNDLAILKRLTRLTSSASRRILIKRVAKIAAGTAIVAVLTFQVTRWIRNRPATTESGPTPSAALPSAAPSMEASAPSIAPEPTRSAHAERPKIPMPIQTGTPAPPVSGSATAGTGALRDVRITIQPQGATLELDGQVRTWGAPFKLPPGAHPYKITSPEGAKCCKSPKEGTLTVVPAPAEKPDEPQIVILQLELNPASATLAGAPANSQVVCGGLVTLSPGQTQKGIKLNRPDQLISCVFTSPDGPALNKSVSLKAGEANTINWPQ
jgi:serine/threonine-protein kinase